MGKSKKKLDKSKKNLEELVEKKEKLIARKKLYEKNLEKASIYDLLEKAGYDPLKIEEEMPESIAYIKRSKNKDKQNIEDIKIDLESKTLAILTDYWYYSGSGGCEYGKTLEVFRGESSDSKTYVYRDAYSASKDDWSLAFKEISDIIVEGDKVTIKLKSNERTLDYKTKMPYVESKGDTLSDSQKEEFLKTYKTEKEKLLKTHTRDKGIMRDYIPLDLTRFATGRTIPYKKAESIDEFVDEKHGVARIVIKSQIDHDSGRGMQFEWVKYKITKDSSEMLERECAYEIELKEGKEIKMKA